MDPPGVPRHGDHVLEDHILGQEIEVVVTVDEAVQPLLDDAEERAVRAERGVVTDGLGHCAAKVQAWALRSANSRKVAGLRPVTFSMSSAGTEPDAGLAARRGMTLARDHLRAGDLSLAQIAGSVGYGSPFAFAAAFRRHHGGPPGAWRQRERAAAGTRQLTTHTGQREASPR